MSSILKALKKLENQATDQSHILFWRPQDHSFKDDPEQMNGRLRVKKTYIIILFGLVFAVCAGLVLSQKFHERKPKLIAKKEVSHQKPVRLPQKKAVVRDINTLSRKPVRLPKKKTTMPSKKVIPKMPPRFPGKRAAAAHKIQKELTPRKRVKKAEPIAKAVKSTPMPSHKFRKDTAVPHSNKSSSLKQVRKGSVFGKPAETPGQKAKPDRFASMPVKRSNQTKIEIQAIAWSNDPKSRLAVINGLIMRERESIDNVMVMHIGRDAVIFKKERDEWKQMFGF